jgi:hypothetical protein
MNDQIDSVLTGVIILLVLIVVWKWVFTSPYKTGFKLSCGCTGNICRCRGSAWGPVQQQPRRKSGGCNHNPRGNNINVENMHGRKESFSTMEDRERIASSNGHYMNEEDLLLGGDYSGDSVKKMGLESDVGASHKRYCDSLSFSGMPTGASACTTLEETGRSINTSNFVGLTARKFCRARALATPSSTARTTSSKDIIENCGMDSESLI